MSKLYKFFKIFLVETLFNCVQDILPVACYSNDYTLRKTINNNVKVTWSKIYITINLQWAILYNKKGWCSINEIEAFIKGRRSMPDVPRGIPSYFVPFISIMVCWGWLFDVTLSNLPRRENRSLEAHWSIFSWRYHWETPSLTVHK